MRGRVMGAIIVGLAVTTAVAAAATLAINADDLGAGQSVVASCDGNFTASYQTSAGKVTTVTVGEIADPDCEGGRLWVTLTKDGAAIGSGGPETIPTDGDTSDNSLPVALSPQPNAADVNGIHIAVVGP